jgi:hypothetical protein
MLVAPRVERDDDRPEITATIGQQILIPRRTFGVAAPFERPASTRLFSRRVTCSARSADCS